MQVFVELVLLWWGQRDFTSYTCRCSMWIFIAVGPRCQWELRNHFLQCGTETPSRLPGQDELLIVTWTRRQIPEAPNYGCKSYRVNRFVIQDAKEALWQRIQDYRFWLVGYYTVVPNTSTRILQNYGLGCAITIILSPVCRHSSLSSDLGWESMRSPSTSSHQPFNYWPRGHRDLKKRPGSTLDVDWAGKSISEGFKVVGRKLSKMLVHLYFVGFFFFLFCFRLVEPMRIFF